MKRESLPSLGATAVIVFLSSVVAIGSTYIYSQANAGTLKAPLSSTGAVAQTDNTPPIIEAVSALGYIKPKGEIIRLSAPNSLDGTTARIAEISATEGSELKKDEVVAILDSVTSREATLNQSLAALKIAEAELARVRAGASSGAINAQDAEVARLDAELRNALAEYDRFNALFQAGAVSASERDSKQTLLETAAASLAQALAAREDVSEVRPVDVDVAAAKINDARAAVEKATAELERAYIRTPIAGQVLKVHSRAGEVVNPQGILEIAQTDQMIVIAEVYETDIERVKIGQAAIVVSGATEGKLKGTVSQIGLQVSQQESFNTDPTATTDNRVVEVEITLEPDSSQQVRDLSNLQVQVVIQV